MEDTTEPLACCKPSAGRPRASDVEERMHNLVHTAGQLFLKHGYNKVSLESIAREAHVAVRTIYVKFGGKAGLFQAVLLHKREHYFKANDMDDDMRPVRQVVADFALHFLELITSPQAIRILNVLMAEAPGTPELAKSYFEAGPEQTRSMLTRYFARPDVRVQLRDDVAPDLLPVHLLNCILGEQLVWRLIAAPSPAATAERLPERLELFFRSVLRHP
jgi:TetR/AcrR family transcriptional regulator, mexJK operon transcriptional repressor